MALKKPYYLPDKYTPHLTYDLAGLWTAWDETGASIIGDYLTREEAVAGIDEYTRTHLQPQAEIIL